MGRHKKVPCRKCLRIMRSDKLKIHMKQHEKKIFEKESFSGSTFSSSTTSLQEDCKSVSSFSSVSTNTSTPINKEFVIKTMEMNADKYRQDMEVGKIVAESIKNGEIPQDSLSNEHKDALDLYWNKKQLMNIDNVILKTWQSALIEYMKKN